MARADLKLEIKVDTVQVRAALNAAREAIFGPNVVMRRTLRLLSDSHHVTVDSFAAIAWPLAWTKGGAAHRAVSVIARRRLADAAKAGYAHVAFEPTGAQPEDRQVPSIWLSRRVPVYEISARGRKALADAKKPFPQGGK